MGELEYMVYEDMKKEDPSAEDLYKVYYNPDIANAFWKKRLDF